MRHDVRRNLPDGLHQYGSSLKWHVWHGGLYHGGFADKRAAENKLRVCNGLKPLHIFEKKKNGVIQDPGSKFWHVWVEGVFYGAFKFELTAQQKYAKSK